VGTLLAFGSAFAVGDAFLKFLLEDFLEKFLSFGAKKVVEVVEGVTVGGVVHDEFAFGDQGIEVFDENGTNVRRGGRGSGYKMLPCKSPIKKVYQSPTKFGQTTRTCLFKEKLGKDLKTQCKNRPKLEISRPKTANAPN
jgi:hypothetical protein